MLHVLETIARDYASLHGIARAICWLTVLAGLIVPFLVAIRYEGDSRGRSPRFVWLEFVGTLLFVIVWVGMAAGFFVIDIWARVEFLPPRRNHYKAISGNIFLVAVMLGVLLWWLATVERPRPKIEDPI